ncbi:LTA synthase family protein [Streptococcus himalayensis]|uniref:Phosphoglycerol transferase n=1 Tax=Streptococcus himalayensis TaxID=1888195 RepID=A0A917A5C9_9STRE|nr:LTA synthase family protein [Streptococcus himalayensis]GGE27966.1 phosphoglycerol transferase [Streptococcus himalayensis]
MPIKQKLYYLLLLFLFYIISYKEITYNIIGIGLLRSSHLEQYYQMGFTISIIILIWVFSNYVSVKLFFELTILYLFYLTSSYFMKMTLKINDNQFIWNQFSKNHFLQTNFVWILVIILSLSFIVRVIKEFYFPTLINLSTSRLTYRILVSQFLTSFILTGNQMKDRILTNRLISIDLQNKGEIFQNLFIYTLLCYLVISVLSYLFIKACGNLFKNKVSLSLAVTTSVILGAIFNYYIQIGITEYGKWYDYYIVSGATFFQIFILTGVFLGVYLICNRYIFGTVFNIIFGTAISVINSIKFDMRSEPFIPADLSWWKEFQTLSKFISIDIVPIMWGIFLLLFFTLYLQRRGLLSGKIVSKNWKRLLYVVLIWQIFVGIVHVFSQAKDENIPKGIPVLSSVNNVYDIAWQGLNARARFQSLSYVWMKQFSIKVMETPVRYSKSAIDEIVQKYKTHSNELNRSRINSISDQTVIYVLSESLSNPKHIPQITASTEVLPNIEEIKSKTTSGMMKSDGYGGGTANMEFQTLTGLPKYNFTSFVSILYTEVVPRFSIFPTISDQFLSNNRIVLHFAHANNYSRNIIYKRLDFDKQIFLKNGNVKIEPPSILGAHPSDQSTYDELIRQLDVNESQFFSVMTMQNHAPWYFDTPENLIVTGEGFTNSENSSLTSYSRLLYQTDQATKKFLDDLSKVNKKITVVFYGDHLPGLYPKSAFEKNPDSQYLTDYFIWSNFDTPKLDYPLVNSSDFTALTLEQTNSKVSPYYALLTEVLHKASVDKNELDDEGRAIAEDLKLVQYDLVAGKGYLPKEFFEIPK